MAEPLSEPHPKRVPTTVVAGVDPRQRARLIRLLAAGRPGGERWAWIGSDLRADGPDDDVGGSDRPVDDPALARFAVAGGCACCLAGPAFRVSLARVLREGRWHRVIIDVASGGHPDRVVDQLRTPPFDGHLIVTAMPLVVGPSEWPLYRPGRSPGAVDPARARLEFATDLLLATDTGVGSDAVVSLAAVLASAPPWPSLERIAGRPLHGSASDLSVPLSGWRIFSRQRASPDPEGTGPLARCWPAATTMARRRVQERLSVLADDPGVAGFQAVLRTPRAWYCWCHGRVGGCVELGPGGRIDEAETGWRFDNRILVWLAAGANRRSVRARLAQLDLAIQGPDGPVDTTVG